MPHVAMHVSQAPCSDASCPRPHVLCVLLGYAECLMHAPCPYDTHALCIMQVPSPMYLERHASCTAWPKPMTHTCNPVPHAPCPMSHALMMLHVPQVSKPRCIMAHAPHVPCPPNLKRSCIMSGALHQNRAISLERLWGLRMIAVISEFQCPPAPHSISFQSNLVLPIE